MSVDFHTSLNPDECVSRLADALSASRQFSGEVEGNAFHMDKRRALSLTAPKEIPIEETALWGEFIAQESGTLVRYTPRDPAEGGIRPVEWKRLLKVLLPLLAVAALLLILLGITSVRDWLLALVLPALLIALLVARQAFAAFQRRAAEREMVDFLQRVLTVE